ncbi:dihydrolipoamide acetyltransferase family protein [Cellulomonas fimi]|uniref:Dihydrolipoamide acetyltransferase component of pyruvate dehydrogenase complex n=1 Tax=Cellulomonas fimi TaxID=1708 RepID=A0A7Y0LXK4_CELFI|nr:dihydrolipoamide acetyltransferase family protein [Cellulomonas fimi]NMR20033.1 2-oxo acid dehydrogenase subunit E2 [Cellulomonas fimi]
MPTFEQFRLPDAGEGLTEAEIVAWHVAVGDEVEVNQTIVEIETAKSLVDLPSPFAGVVSELLVEPGQTVEVGTPIITIDTDPTGPASAPSAATGDVSDAARAPGGVSDAARAPGDVSDVARAPGDVSDVARAGDRAGSDTSTAPSEVSESSRAGERAGSDTSVEGESSEAGAVLVGYGVGGHATARRARRPATTPALPAATPAPPAATPSRELSEARESLASPSSDRSALPEVSDRPRAGAHVTPDSSGGSGTAGTAGTTAAHGFRVRAKPPVRKLAKDLEVDLESVAPTGPGGIVTREDVLAHAAQAEARTLATYVGDDQPWLSSGTVSPDGRETRVPVKSVRKRTAEAMVASAFTAPHVTVFHTVDVTRTMKLVARLKEDREFADVRVTPLLVAAKALLIAVNRHPEINASWDDATQEIVYKHFVNLGIAAATPRGLVVPNIKDAHRLTLTELAQEIGSLTSTARAGRTSPVDMSGGTITITNVGVFGIDTGTPILNPGEAAILAFGAIREQPWVHHGKVKKRWVTQLALSFDHRLVDGALGSRLLSDVAKVLEDPAQALVWG